MAFLKLSFGLKWSKETRKGTWVETEGEIEDGKETGTELWS